MATRKHTSPENRDESTGNISPLTRRRASQRQCSVIRIDLSERALRELMTEQCKSGSHYITVYRGTRAMLTAAGIPESVFHNAGARFPVQTVNACCTGKRERVSGLIEAVGDEFEMEIDWGLVRPYMQAAHPAVCELARILLITVGDWTRYSSGPSPDLALLMDILADLPMASGYKPKRNARRLQVTPEFHEALRERANDLFQFVHSHCEVLPVTDGAAVKRRPKLRLVANDAAGVPHV